MTCQTAARSRQSLDPGARPGGCHERVPGNRRDRDERSVLGRCAATAVKTASQTLRDLRVAEVVEQDLHIEEEGGEIIFRTKLRLSFKYDVGHAHLHQ